MTTAASPPHPAGTDRAAPAPGGRAQRAGTSQSMLGQRVLDPPRIGHPDPLIDLECLAQVRGGFSRVAGPAGCGRFPPAHALPPAGCRAPGRGERLAMLAVRLPGAPRSATTARPGCSAPWPGRAGRRGRGTARWPRQAGRGGQVVPGQLLDQAELVQCPGLAEPVAELAEQVQGLLLVGQRGRIVAQSAAARRRRSHSASASSNAEPSGPRQRQRPLIADRAAA